MQSIAETWGSFEAQTGAQMRLAGESRAAARIAFYAGATAIVRDLNNLPEADRAAALAQWIEELTRFASNGANFQATAGG